MKNDIFKYFKLASELNKVHHNALLKNKLHFRANMQSISLISLARETAEKGKSGIKSISTAEQYVFYPEKLKLSAPKRITPEKELQAWIILSAISNDNILPFGNDLRFITSELVMPNKSEYGLKLNKRDYRNDILAIDNNNSLCVIELKSKRDNTVKEQTVDFETIVLNEIVFFSDLTKIVTHKEWNGKCRKIAVWPRLASGNGKKDYILPDVEEINYSENSNDWFYSFD